MSKEKGENERFESSGSYEDLNGDKEVETPKAAGVIAEWREMNRKLRYHGYQPVMVLPCSQLQQIPRGAVVLEELTSKTLRETLAKLMTDCDRRQSMVQQLITSSRRIQKDADEERNRVYHYEMKIRNLQKELDEEKLKTQEMERMHLVELQNHGEVKELKRSISEVVALHTKLEQKVAQKEAEITRLQQQCQDLTDMKEKKLGGQSSELKSKCKNDKVDQKLLDFIDNYESQLSKIEQDVDHLKKQTETDLTVVCSDVEPSTSQSENSASISTVNSLPKEGDGSDMVTGPTANIVARKKEIKVVQDKFMSAEKQLKDSKKLIKLLESENTCLKMELESRPNREEWKNSRKYNRQLEKLLALNNLRPPHQKHKDKRSVKTESSASRQRQYATQVEDIGFLPIDVCRSYLKEVCSGLEVIDLKDILDKIHIMKLSMQSYPAMERLIKDIIDVVNSEDAPRLTTEVLSEGTHEFHCERAWLNIVPILRVWLRELSGLKDLQASVMKLSLQLKPWKSESELKRDRRPLTVQSIREAVDILSQENRASPSEIRTGEETSLDQLKSIVAHFQNLFDVNTIEGTFPRMSEVYMRLGESSNLMNNLRDILGLEQACKASDIVNVVAKLSKAKHLLKVEDLHGIIKRLDQYDEFFPAFQSLVSELKKLLRVQEMDEILTAVTALVNFPNY